MKTKHTSRTLEYLRGQGYVPWIVERWTGNVRSDCFGWMDILCYRSGTCGALGVQSCGVAFSAHNMKLLQNQHLQAWLECGNLAWLVGWRKVKKARGGVAVVYRPRVKVYTPEDWTQ